MKHHLNDNEIVKSKNNAVDINWCNLDEKNALVEKKQQKK